MTFTRKDVANLRDELQKELDKFAESRGIKITFGNATYNDTAIHFKVDIVGAGEDNERERWVEHSKYLGLYADDYGKEIMLNGDLYKVVGIKPKARKNCIVIEQMSNKKRYVISRDTFVRCGGKDVWAAL